MRINDLTVVQASQVFVLQISPAAMGLRQGLCAYVLDAATRGIDRWAKLTAAAFVDKGVRMCLFSGFVRTIL